MKSSVFAAFCAYFVAASAFAGPTVCKTSTTTPGVDVSKWQGTIDFAKVAKTQKFVIARVSDGTYIDKLFATYWPAIKANGMVRGAYQYFEPATDAITQADILLNMMGPMEDGMLPPTLDVEATGGLTPAKVEAGVQQWVDYVQAKLGVKPMIYTGNWFWDPSVNSSKQSNLPLWESYYCNNCCPKIPLPWTTWAIWQYSDSGTVSGISGACDMNEWNGDLASLQAFVGGGTSSGPVCGNGTCESGETCTTCASDCGCASGQVCKSGSCVSDYCPGYTGSSSCCTNGNPCKYATNGTCDCDGTCSWEAAECVSGPMCGDGYCDSGEDCANCAGDCGCAMGEICSGGVCSADYCPGYAGSSACCVNGDPCGYAGDGYCDCEGACSWESSDCSAPVCGDGYCTGGEDCNSCVSDCGSCSDGGSTSYCGDFYCDMGETCSNCPSDCGDCDAGSTSYCGDGYCDSGEDCNSCSSDCGNCPVTDAGTTDTKPWEIWIVDSGSGGCKSNNDCPGACDLASGTCVECNVSTDCPTGKQCKPGKICESVCGDGVCAGDESNNTCCIDCPCAGGKQCVGGKCGGSGSGCSDNCPKLYASQCAGPTSYHVCQKASGGCIAWDPVQTCMSGLVCYEGLCVDPATIPEVIEDVAVSDSGSTGDGKTGSDGSKSDGSNSSDVSISSDSKGGVDGLTDVKIGDAPSTTDGKISSGDAGKGEFSGGGGGGSASGCTSGRTGGSSGWWFCALACACVGWRRRRAS